MTTERPMFLNEEFLTACLRSEEESGTVISFETEPVLPENFNFGSIILRVKTYYKKDGEDDVRIISLIVKFPPEKDCLKMGYTINVREHNFYSTIVPQFSKFFDVNIFPKSFSSPIPSVVVLEDLCSSKYKTPSRFDQLDYNHCKLYFQAAAKIHAASIVMVEKDPNIIESFGNSGNWLIYQDPDLRKVFRSYSSIGVKCLADFVRHNDDYKGIVQILDDVADDVWDQVVAAEKAEGHLKCFVQRDCYSANMMFKYDNDGFVESLKLFDFQLHSYLPLVVDIIHFVWRSADDDVRENRLDELYKFYCDNLNQNFTEFESSKSITFQELKDQLNALSSWALHMVSFYLPFGQTRNPIDLHTLFHYSTENPQMCYDLVNEMIRESPTLFSRILKHLRDQGVLESIRKYHTKQNNTDM